MNIDNDETYKEEMNKDKPKKKRGRKSNKEVDKIENYDPEKTSDVDNLILNLKGGHAENKNILPGYEYSVSESCGLNGLDGLEGLEGLDGLDGLNDLNCLDGVVE